MLDELKRCKECGETKPLSEFYRQQGRWPYPQCKPCHYARTRARVVADNDRIRARERARYWANRPAFLEKKRRQKYGITERDRLALIEAQGAACPICLRPLGPTSVGDRLGAVVDHDHETGRVRGVLHRECNLALNLIASLPDGANRRAQAYLEGEVDARRTA